MMTRGTQRGKANAQPILLLLLGPLVLSSCAAAPFLVPIAFEFAKNLFQTGLSNYGSKHRDNLSNLVNRLSSPYMQGLPPMQIGAPGMAGFGGPSPVPGQPGWPGQPGLPGQPGVPQAPLPGQPGTLDPNNPYGAAQQMNPAATQFPGMSTVPGSTVAPYGTAQGYPSQPGINPYDPNNPYGAAATNPYGQPVNPYGQQTNPYGASSPYGQPASPYGTTSPYGYGSNPYGQISPYGQTNPYGQMNPYGQTNQYGQINPYGQTNAYGMPNQSPNPYGYPNYDPNNPYGNQAQSAYGQPYGQQQPGYGTPSPYGYGTQPNQQPYGAYGSTPQPYGSQPYGASPYGGQQPYGATGIYPRGLGGDPVAVEVALVRQKQTDKGKEVVLMNDGEVLKDGGANPEVGDRFKIVVRLNCDCYLYIMSIDGSGWADPVFPKKDGKTVNPVKKDQEYAFPEGPHWFTLDQIKGIESFFVVGAANRRSDLEESFAQIGAEKRPDTKIVAHVEEAPVIPQGVASVKVRGILTVKDDTGASIQVTPLSYSSDQAGQDVTVTRWFKHE